MQSTADKARKQEQEIKYGTKYYFLEVTLYIRVVSQIIEI